MTGSDTPIHPRSNPSPPPCPRPTQPFLPSRAQPHSPHTTTTQHTAHSTYAPLWKAAAGATVGRTCRLAAPSRPRLARARRERVESILVVCPTRLAPRLLWPPPRRRKRQEQPKSACLRCGMCVFMIRECHCPGCLVVGRSVQQQANSSGRGQLLLLLVGVLIGRAATASGTRSIPTHPNIMTIQ
jgi:hypothetical protein